MSSNYQYVMRFIKMSHLPQISDFVFDTPLERRDKELCFNTKCVIQIPKFVMYHALECAISERISIEDLNIKMAIS